MTAPLILPSLEPHPRFLESGDLFHDTCPECGWDGDAALIRDEGFLGWECPECFDVVTVRPDFGADPDYFRDLAMEDWS